MLRLESTEVKHTAHGCRPVFDHCLKLNESITDPLGYNEVRGIAKAFQGIVGNEILTVTLMFIERQTLKGRKGGLKGGVARSAQYSDLRLQAKQLHEQGRHRCRLPKF